MRIVTFVSATLSGLLFLATATAQCAPHMPPAGPPPKPEGGITGAQGRPTTPAAPAPAGPAAPAPGRPAAPAAPTTGGPETPRAPTTTPTTPRIGGPQTGARGIPLNFERGPTAKDRLRIDWMHPVPPHQEGTETAAAGAMPKMAALSALWDKDDDRPLLVLRECSSCAGTDDALLHRSTNNDRTMLLTKWFRTVRLPAHVTQTAHPFYNLFAAEDYSEQSRKTGMPHLFLLAEPGAKPVFFSGQQTPGELSRVLCEVLELRYAKDPKKAVKSWMSLLDKFDTLDASRRQLEDQLAQVRATDGPKSSRAQKLAEQLEDNTKERERTLESEKKVRDLGLLPMSRAPFAATEVALAK